MNMELIQQLRTQTGAGIVEVKKALEEANQDYDKAIELLRKRGQKVAAKKQDRVTSEGIVEAYIHGNGRVGVLVKLNCETDFVARTDRFKKLAHEIAMHVAAFNPTFISSTNVPAEMIAKEKEVYKELLAKEGKPEAVIEKIMEGKLQKFSSDICLLDQAFALDDKKTVRDIITEAIAELGENIQVADFKRISL
jgi:elongation factor Ts